MISSDKIHLHKNDLPDDVKFKGSVAVDTETMGLNYYRDRLCLVQISAGDGIVHMVKFTDDKYHCPNLKKMLADTKLLKIFHYARSDLAMIKQKLKIEVSPVYCTKIASRIARTNALEHGLSALCKELLDIHISKEETCSDWGAEELTERQIQYAAADVLYLHEIKKKLDYMLEREGRTNLAQGCFDFLNTRAELDRLGWVGIDIMAHK